MKNAAKLLILASLFVSTSLFAQSEKLPIYGHVAIGYGNTFFYGTLAEKETINDGRGFGRNQGNTLSTFFLCSSRKMELIRYRKWS